MNERAGNTVISVLPYVYRRAAVNTELKYGVVVLRSAKVDAISIARFDGFCSIAKVHHVDDLHNREPIPITYYHLEVAWRSWLVALLLVSWLLFDDEDC